MRCLSRWRICSFKSASLLIVEQSGGSELEKLGFHNIKLLFAIRYTRISSKLSRDFSSDLAGALRTLHASQRLEKMGEERVEEIRKNGKCFGIYAERPAALKTQRWGGLLL
jgi:hypothetical protein